MRTLITIITLLAWFGIVQADCLDCYLLAQAKLVHKGKTSTVYTPVYRQNTLNLQNPAGPSLDLKAGENLLSSPSFKLTDTQQQEGIEYFTNLYDTEKIGWYTVKEQIKHLKPQAGDSLIFNKYIGQTGRYEITALTQKQHKQITNAKNLQVETRYNDYFTITLVNAGAVSANEFDLIKEYVFFDGNPKAERKKLEESFLRKSFYNTTMAELKQLLQRYIAILDTDYERIVAAKPRLTTCFEQVKKWIKTKKEFAYALITYIDTGNDSGLAAFKGLPYRDKVINGYEYKEVYKEFKYSPSSQEDKARFMMRGVPIGCSDWAWDNTTFFHTFRTEAGEKGLILIFRG